MRTKAVRFLAFTLLVLVPWMALADEAISGSGSAEGSASGNSKAEKCGERGEREGLGQSEGGMTYCGRAVAIMVSCMTGKTAEECKCGNGQDYAECSGGQLKKCGYEKVGGQAQPTSSERAERDKCAKTPGAVLAYKYDQATDSDVKAWTENGKKYGHVEFNCSADESKPKYCSVYKKPPEREKPWPRDAPDSCWLPKS